MAMSSMTYNREQMNKVEPYVMVGYYDNYIDKILVVIGEWFI